ncbi:SagB/ThcOx family dehydrogenase [Clostridium bovifaecis]|uniref:SagB/ThcOx family dehydrogenase n=1 Tax=Clostridium bovifaecis TaxID=2184719 RepID=A0A6I6F571_9CLOT|nr:SagB/ThcOx family dehydrogenase [Clostridium bovifaecis]
MNGIGREFVEKTKDQYEDTTDQQKGVPQPPLQLELDPTDRVIDLPKPSEIKEDDVSLREVIDKRRTLRVYSEEAMTLDELSYLLWCTQGVQKIRPNNVTERTVPSGGARHAFETYLLVNNVKGLKAGIYRFLAIEHKLVEVNMNNDISEKIVKGCFGQKFIGKSAVTFIWVAVRDRMTWRYGDRGYRYMFLDAGHVCQNLYLSAESIDSGVCAVASFDDDEMNRLLNLDGEEQFVIYIGTVGKRKE